MTKTVAQLTQEIARLQGKIEQVKSKEVAGVVARIREAIDYYGLTPEQIFGVRLKGSSKRKGSSAGPRTVASAPRSARGGFGATLKAAAQASKLAGTKLPAKFADDAGNSWTGRGSTPKWLVEAIAAGKSKEDFAVKS